jgi:hypothetical protein
VAEFSLGGGKVWYDISIIPPGPGNCDSFENCRTVTGKSGFNVGMMIYPFNHQGEKGSRCNWVMCQYDGCPDAYQFPADNTKVYNCPDNELFHVIFCP